MSLFDFLKKDNSCICAPVDGFCVDITKCSDQVFAEKMMGDGFMVIPSSDVVCAPADGEISMIFSTLHAFGMKMANGQELLVHIGINTVELNGLHFKKLAKVNSRVKKGTPVIEYDRKKIIDLGYDINVLVVVVGQNEVVKAVIDHDVCVKDVIIEE